MIELPKDAEGREIPLDTRVLYDEDGNAKEVQRYTYSVRQTIPRRKWDAVMLDTTCRYTSNLYITPPAPPDSWEKLEDDLGRVASCSENATPVCAYTRQPCAVCKLYSSDECISAMCADIASRIRKLRGEG